jgi:hypothetical protein
VLAKKVAALMRHKPKRKGRLTDRTTNAARLHVLERQTSKFDYFGFKIRSVSKIERNRILVMAGRCRFLHIPDFKCSHLSRILATEPERIHMYDSRLTLTRFELQLYIIHHVVSKECRLKDETMRHTSRTPRASSALAPL